MCMGMPWWLTSGNVLHAGCTGRVSSPEHPCRGHAGAGRRPRPCLHTRCTPASPAERCQHAWAACAKTCNACTVAACLLITAQKRVSLLAVADEDGVEAIAASPASQQEYAGWRYLLCRAVDKIPNIMELEPSKPQDLEWVLEQLRAAQCAAATPHQPPHSMSIHASQMARRPSLEPFQTACSCAWKYSIHLAILICGPDHLQLSL